MTYQQSVEKAKDAAVEFGLNSLEYHYAVLEMQRIYKEIKKPFLFKVINQIARIKWLLQRKA